MDSISHRGEKQQNPCRSLNFSRIFLDQKGVGEGWFRLMKVDEGKSKTVFSCKVLVGLVNSIKLSVLNIRLYVERCAFLFLLQQTFKQASKSCF